MILEFPILNCVFLCRAEFSDTQFIAVIILIFKQISLVMRKPAFCICENKEADQLRGNREADQRLCFRYTDSTIPLLPKFEISSLWPSSVAAQPGLCRTWSETPKTGFLTTRLIFKQISLSIARCLQKKQTEWKTVHTLMRQLFQEQSDLGLQCLVIPICPKF